MAEFQMESVLSEMLIYINLLSIALLSLAILKWMELFVVFLTVTPDVCKFNENS